MKTVWIASISAALWLIGALGPAWADEAYKACMDASDGTNVAWSQCGSAWLDREDARLNSAWKQVYPQLEAASKKDLLEEQRLWLAFKEKSCLFWYDGDFGREGQVLHFPTCRAAVLSERTKYLRELKTQLTQE